MGTDRSLGLAFQIVDDILDIEGSSAEMGKAAGSDLRKHKATHPAVFGLDASRAEAARLLEEARHAVRRSESAAPSWSPSPNSSGDGDRDEEGRADNDTDSKSDGVRDGETEPSSGCDAEFVGDCLRQIEHEKGDGYVSGED